MPLSTAFAPFRIRAYRFQWPADLVVSWAFEMETLILGWYVLVETGSVLFLTIYGALLYGGTLIAPIVGVTSDRIGHRKLLAAMRAIYAVVAAVLMALAFTGVLSPLLVLVLAAVSGLVRPSDMGLRGARDRRRDAGEPDDRRDELLAHHLRHRTHRRRADRRWIVRRVRHRAGLCGDHRALRARLGADLVGDPGPRRAAPAPVPATAPAARSGATCARASCTSGTRRACWRSCGSRCCSTSRRFR